MTTWLADKSALLRFGLSVDAAEWADRIDRGLVRIASVTRLEVGYSARSAQELRKSVEEAPLAAMPTEFLTPAMENRAVEVQMLLADSGLHRAPSIPDLLIAAIAEISGLTVVHLDKDFELIAEITGQSTERVRL